MSHISHQKKVINFSDLAQSSNLRPKEKPQIYLGITDFIFESKNKEPKKCILIVKCLQHD